MFTNPIVINSIDLSSILEGLHTISQVLSENAKDRTMLYIAIGSLILTALTIFFSIRSSNKAISKATEQIKITAEQTQVQIKQLEMQKIYWRNEVILKYKQKKILELLEKYIKFKDVVTQLHKIMGPGAISAKNQKFGDFDSAITPIHTYLQRFVILHS